MYQPPFSPGVSWSGLPVPTPGNACWAIVLFNVPAAYGITFAGSVANASASFASGDVVLLAGGGAATYTLTDTAYLAGGNVSLTGNGYFPYTSTST